MTTIAAGRAPERYVHGLHGPCVVVPARITAVLVTRAGLADYHAQHRGEDPELDAVLVALKVTAAAWRSAVADHGNEQTKYPAGAAVSTQWLSTAQAARRLGCSPRTVRWAIAAGRLSAEWVGGGWVLYPADVEHYRARRAAA